MDIDTTTPLRSLNPSRVQASQKKYPTVIVHIKTETMPINALNRCVRGGNWNNNAVNCRVSNRNNNNPGNRNNNIGLRLSNTENRQNSANSRIPHRAFSRPNHIPARLPGPSNTPWQAALGKICLAACIFCSFGPLPAQTTLPPEMVFVPGGTFTMGCTPEQQPDCISDETPTRRVRLPAFEIGKYEVTQAQWQAVMGYNPGTGYGTSPDRPVYSVSYYDCATFCNRLSQQQGLERVYYFDRGFTQPFDSLVGDYNIYVDIYANPDAKGYRLPTEAEWEYAARGGPKASTQTKYSGSDNLDAVGWYFGNNTPYGCKPVGQKLPNALGIYDMSGNVWEWCFDEYAGYGSGASCSGALARCVRGGDWNNDAVSCRVSYRSGIYPGGRVSNVGLRLSRTP